MELSVAAVSFGILIVAELGDKTQLAVFSLTARSGRLLPVFLGATLALSMVTLIGVVAGTVVGELIPMSWLSRLAGAAFIVIGAFMLWSSRSADQHKEEKQESGQPSSIATNPIGVFGVSFGLLFAAEMGDKTQLAVLGMVVKSGSPVSVFVGASLALTLLTLIAVLAGKVVTKIVPVYWVSRGAALMFIGIGALTLSGIF